jgi:hypothetical protein
MPILFKRLNIKGSTLRSRSPEYQGELLGRFEREALGDLGAEGGDKEMKVSIHKVSVAGDVDDFERKLNFVRLQVYSWEDVIEAHKEMEANKNSGKVSLQFLLLQRYLADPNDFT